MTSKYFSKMPHFVLNSKFYMTHFSWIILDILQEKNCSIHDYSYISPMKYKKWGIFLTTSQKKCVIISQVYLIVSQRREIRVLYRYSEVCGILFRQETLLRKNKKPSTGNKKPSTKNKKPSTKKQETSNRKPWNLQQLYELICCQIWKTIPNRGRSRESKCRAIRSCFWFVSARLHFF